MKFKLIPPVYLTILIISAFLLHYFMPIKQIIFKPYHYFGWLIIILGLALALWANRLFFKYKTDIHPYGQPTSFIITGPYRFTRNPIYLGGVIVLLGLAILLKTLTPLIAPVLFLIIMDRQFIRMEEKKLTKIFGQQYIAYTKKVRRWI